MGSFCFKWNCSLILAIGLIVYLIISFAEDLYSVGTTFQTVHTFTIDTSDDAPTDTSHHATANVYNDTSHDVPTINTDMSHHATANVYNDTSHAPDAPPDTIVLAESVEPINESTASLAELRVGRFPYMAAILHVNQSLLGAGAIVATRWIIATAFQMGAFKPYQLVIRVGSNSWQEGGQVLAVQNVFPHPMFRQFNNDVAMLKTAEDITLGPSVQPITLVETAPEIGAQAVLLMWDTGSHIEESQADILPASECRMFYPDFELTVSTICAIIDHVLPYKVVFYGSPLVYNGSLVGHYMGMEANTFKPSLYSSLAPLSGWVRLMMSNETNTPLLFPLS